MSFERLKLFPTPLIIDRLEDYHDANAELERTIMEKMAHDPGIKRSNLGGWHSDTDLLEWGGEPAQRIAAHALGLANANTRTARGANLHWHIVAWANVNGPGSGNSAHVHGGNFWSAVYYVKVPVGEGGHLRLYDPRMPALRMHSPVLRFADLGPEVTHKMKPREGQIILFPAWLSHSVEAWDGKDNRISIAMNIRRSKRRTAVPYERASASEPPDVK